MKHHTSLFRAALFRMLAAFAAAWLTLPPASAAPGDPDTLAPVIIADPTKRVFATAIQPDGKIVIGGTFTSVNGVARNNIARLNADGTLDTGFDPNANGLVDCALLQPDGKIVIGGQFTTLQPNGAASATTRRFMARVNADGTLDTSFDPRPNNQVYCLALQTDAKIVLGGNFTTLQPNGAASATTRNYLARVNADGTLDTAYNPRPNNPVYSMAMHSTGSIVLGGVFTTLQPNGAATATTRNRIARVVSTGDLDSGFNPNANGIVNAVAVEPDGQVLLGGEFTTLQPNGNTTATTRNRIARVNNSGTLDSGFNPNANAPLYSMAVQADGDILLAGPFTTLQPNGAASPTLCSQIARVNADGTLDAGFNPTQDANTAALMLQNDGALLLGGSFSTVGGLPRTAMARLQNDPPGVTLTQTNQNQVNWTRTGTAPDVTRVTFELSTTGGASWTTLGNGVRVGTSSTWQLTGLSLPGSGLLRARGRVFGGYFAGSSGIVEQVQAFGPVMNITGNGQTITSGDITPSLTDHTDFGEVVTGTSFERTFTVQNLGPTALDFSPSPFAEISGPNAADFVCLDNTLISVASGASTTVRFRFTPGGPGLRSATVTIGNNSANANPYTFTIQGTGVRPVTTVAINPDAASPNPSRAATVTWLVGFGSSVTGLSAANLTLTSSGLDGSPQITAVTPVSGGSASASWRVTASTGTGDGTLELRLANDTGLSHSVSNLAGAASTFTIDRTPPTATISISDDALTSGEFATVTMAFSEPVQGLGGVHYGVPNGMLTFDYQPDPATYVFYFTPNPGIIAPVNAVRLEFDPTGFSPVRDIAGNPGAGVVNSPNFTIHTANLTPSITGAATSEDTQTTSGLVLTRNANDPNSLATHFKVTGITSGSLFLNDGVSLITNESFLTFAQANSGLRFTPAADCSGNAGFSIQASTTGDDSGLSDGVVNAVVTVTPVNDAPSFTIGGNRTHAYGTTSAQSFGNGATGIGDGDPDFTQALAFNVSHDNPALFTVPPSIAADGALTYTPSGIAGTALVSVSLMDDASAGGPAQTTAVQTFTITVDPASNDSTIASISIGGIGVDPAFSPAITNYTGTAPPGSTGITITPAAGGSHATIEARTNGGAWSPVTSGNPSGNLPLSPGVNAIEVRVTAQDGSTTTYTFTITVPSLAEIAVTGNAMDITNGDAAPALADHTDFGTSFTGGLIQRTFTISNPGSEPLDLTGLPQPVSLSGAGASAFQIAAQPATTVPAGGTADFTVSFIPSTGGTHTATVAIPSNDFDEGFFTFTIQGTGVADITPSITSSATNEDTQTSSGLILARNPLDTGNFATHFKITNVANGTLYQNDGGTAVADGSFLTFAQANAGLKFSPAPDYSGSAGFNIQASTNDNDSGLRDGVVPVTIVVSPVNDPPVFTVGGNRTHSYGTTTAQVFSNGTTGIVDGDPDFTQTLSFTVTNDNAALFTAPPAIAADGTLTYTPSGVAGTAVVSVSLTDDSTAGGPALVSPVQTFSIHVLAAQDIAVSGNNVNIVNGDGAPDTADHTDFGSINIADGAIVRTFTLSNNGGSPLVLTGTPKAQVTGTHAADFSVMALPASPVEASGTTTFSVTFDPSATGVRSAEVVIASNDPDENPFIFSVRGTGTVSADSSLASISLPGVSLSPAFNPSVTSYTGSVPGTTTGITLTPSGDSHATMDVRVNGGSWTSVTTGGTTVPLDPGGNTVELRVTAQDGSSTTYTFVITRAAQAAGIDALNPNITGTSVMATAIQPDGKILIGGTFTHVLGTPRQHLARLNADGTLDATFNPKPGSSVYCIAVQNDGKILIGGNFTTLQPNGAPAATTRNRIARLNANGTLDTGFDPNASGFISCIVPQPDGKILLGGSFGTLKPNGGATISRPMLARVNADGTLDSGFAPTPNSSVDSLALQPDGRIVLGGVFTTIKPNGAAVATARQYLARINADGTLDNSFVPNPNNRVHCVVLQPDGRILLGGMFTAVEPNGVPNSAYANYIARVNTDGSLDAAFDPNGNTTVTGIALQSDGKILLGGQFTTLQPNGAGGAVTHNRLARVNANGTLDASFDVQANNIVYGVMLQDDGKVCTGGTFTSLQPGAAAAAVTRNYFARLTNENAVQALSHTGSTQIDWTRSGAAPELSQVSFEQSIDGGVTWTSLGAASRVGTTPNWRLTGVSLPASGQIRARGRTSGGYLGGSSGIVESVVSITTTLTNLEAWRQTHFGSAANSGDGANDNDFDHDGFANLVEFAFGSSPTLPGNPVIPQPAIAGGMLIWSFTQPANTAGIVYQAEWSETMAPGDWHPLTDTGSGADHAFSVSTAGRPKMFTRIRVTAE